MIRVIRINTDGSTEAHSIEPKLAQFQALVGGWIEGIYGDSDWTGYLDEEGKIKGLPLNTTADFVARALGWQGDLRDNLVGPVVFLGGADEAGDATSVTDQVSDLIERMTPGGEIREPDEIKMKDRGYTYTWIGERVAADPEDPFGNDRCFIVDLSVSHDKDRKCYRALVSTAHMVFNTYRDGGGYITIEHRMGFGRQGPDCDFVARVDAQPTQRYSAKDLAVLSKRWLDALRAGGYDAAIRADALGELHRVKQDALA